MSATSHFESKKIQLLGTHLRDKNKSTNLLQIRKGENFINHQNDIIEKRRKQLEENSMNSILKTSCHNFPLIEETYLLSPVERESPDYHISECLLCSENTVSENISCLDTSSNNILKEQIILLKNQLILAGLVPILENITYTEAKTKMIIAIQNLSLSDSQCNIDEFDRWDIYIKAHPSYIKEKQEETEIWNIENKEMNQKALLLQRSIIPINIYNGLSKETLLNLGMSRELATRITRVRSLWIVHMDPKKIPFIHEADLNNVYSFVGLDLTELRALYSCIPDKFENDQNNMKQNWTDNITEKLKGMIRSENHSALRATEIRHQAYSNY
jgi:hypothetical protein